MHPPAAPVIRREATSSAAALARRSVTSGTLGAVAAGSRAASAIGMSVLLDGGNAFDAAVAAALAETVALPSKCGLAGDLVAIHVRAGADEPSSVIALGGAGAGLHDAAADLGWQVPTTGALSVGVPGAPAGYARLAEHGRFELARLAAPAIALARRGVMWTPMNVLLAAESLDLLREHQPDGCHYAPSTGPYAEGAVVRMPGLAETLEQFVSDGAELFHGALGEQLSRYVQLLGGVLTLDDLRGVVLREETAHSVTTAAGPLWATNGPTHGVALTRVFDAAHHEQRAGLSRPDVVRDATTALAAGDVHTEGTSEGTSTVAAADADGNAVVIVHSNSFPQYGSGLVLPGHDLVLSNRAGRGFTWQDGHPNAPRSGRLPLTTLHAWALRDHHGSWVLGATPGGAQQVPWNVQVLDSLMAPDGTDGPDPLGVAVTAPKWNLTEDGIRREGVEMPRLGARSAHTLVRLGPHAVSAAADPRWDATAAAS
jgi:gamma-glutamyltranspeptidase/glutathione hydrolase